MGRNQVDRTQDFEELALKFVDPFAALPGFESLQTALNDALYLVEAFEEEDLVWRAIFVKELVGISDEEAVLVLLSLGDGGQFCLDILASCPIIGEHTLEASSDVAKVAAVGENLTHVALSDCSDLFNELLCQVFRLVEMTLHFFILVDEYPVF